MFNPEVAFYLGDQKNDGYSGVISQDNLFFCLEIHSGISQDQGHQILDFVKEKIKTFAAKGRDPSLHDFDNFISSIITEKNLPSGFSLAAGYLKDDILYLKTAGTGKIFIRRKGKLGMLIEGNNTASGRVENGDFFIFLTDNFINLVGGVSGLGETFDHRSPTEIIEEITPNLKAKQDQGAVALFVNLASLREGDEVDDEAISSTMRSLRHPLGGFLAMTKSVWILMRNSKKTLTFVTVFILFLVFLWSVILGFQRRTNANANEKIRLTKELITQKLSTAEEVSFLNMERAIILINESKEEVNKLNKELRIKNQELEELNLIIAQTENKILKKESRQYSEFFDLSVDDKNAVGNKIYLDEDTAFILDKKLGTIYRLSLEKKSLKKNKFSEIKSASSVAGYEDEGFFYAKGGGVLKISSEGKIVKIIDNSNDWGEIIDLAVFNGNVYLLDRGKDEVWKYLSGEEKYGSASSYFASGQSIDMSSINSLAIDGSVYLAGDSLVVKYTSGLRDGFSVDLPDKDATFDKVFSSKDTDKIYLWDRNKGTIYVLGKTGDYIEQINSEILPQGSDLVVYNGSVYVLKGNKIYKID